MGMYHLCSTEMADLVSRKTESVIATDHKLPVEVQ